MNNVNQAIILAAGRGERLGEYSAEQPKPLTRVNNCSIIDNLMKSLIENKMKKVIIVTGYLANNFEKYLWDAYHDQIELIFIRNKIYDKTNNIYSLWLAEEYLYDSFCLFEADVFFERGIIKSLLTDKSENIILVDSFDSRMNGTVVRLDDNNIVENMYLKKEQGKDFDYSTAYKTVNFYKINHDFSRNFLCTELRKHIKEKNVNSYYELIIKEAITQDFQFTGLVIGNKKWWEIDTPDDLKIANQLFGNIK